MENALETVFKDDVVELDSSRMASKKLRGGAKSHEGRVLVHKGWFSKKWTAKALPARHSSANGVLAALSPSRRFAALLLAPWALAPC